MFKKILIKIYLFGILFSITACFQDVIDISIPENEKQIVIEAVLTDQPESQYVKLSRVSDYFSGREEQPISGAIVKINSEGNEEIQYEEIEPGLYRSADMHGTSGETYYLSVIVEGKIYNAESKMPEAIMLDSLKLVEREYRDSWWGTTSNFYKLECYFEDKQNVENYCWFKYYQNGRPVSSNTYLYNDRNSDGKRIVYDDFEEIYLQGKDDLRLEVVALDKNAYNYIYSLFGYQSDIDIDMPELFPANSYNPKSNISNGGLGYFSACAVRRYIIR